MLTIDKELKLCSEKISILKQKISSDNDLLTQNIMRDIFVWLRIIIKASMVIAATTILTLYSMVKYESATGLLISLVLIVLFCVICTPSSKDNIKKRIEKNQKAFNQKKMDFNQLLTTHLLPEIHNLGIATVHDVTNKTSAKLLEPNVILGILEDQVSRNKMEKISSENNTLYKSLSSAGQDKIERVVLEID